MRIDYNILWFENDDTWLKPTQRNLSSFLDDYGFRLSPTVERDDSNLDALIKKIQDNVVDIDVIFMDYKLAQGAKGDAIIKAIRNTELYTEILFYSYNADVKNIIEADIGSVEGIYYAGRDNFLEKAKTVVRHSIKKVQEVSSMRGLIMSAVSDLDFLMLEIINSFFNNEAFSAAEKANVSKRIFGEVGGAINSKKESFDRFERNDRIDNVIKDNLMFDSSKKAFALQCIIDEIRDKSIEHLKADLFLTPYQNEVIKVRNNFAHVSEIVEEGVRKLKSKSSEEIFTDDRCIEIRRSIIKHGETIAVLKTVICPVSS